MPSRTRRKSIRLRRKARPHFRRYGHPSHWRAIKDDGFCPDPELERQLRLVKARALLATLKAQPLVDIRAENGLNRRLNRLFAQAGQEVIRRLLERGYVPGEPGQQRAIISVLEALLDPFNAVMEQAAQRAANRGRRAVSEELDRLGRPVRLQTFAPRTRDIIAQHAFQASEHTVSRITGDVMGTLAQAYSDGLGIDDAARQLRDQFKGMRDWELRRVARTEINSAQSIGAQLTMQEVGVDYERWVSARDERVRDTHVDIDGEIIKVGGLFSNGLEHPGDTSGPIEEWINCRCRAVPFIPPPGAVPMGSGPWREDDFSVQGEEEARG